MQGQGMQDSKVRDLAAHADQLPLLPSVVVRVLALDSRSDRYFDELVALAEEDPTFAVRLIRVANAPLSAPSTPIVTVRQAVVRIGARECAALVTSVAVSRVFVPRTTAQRSLWVHALQVAVAARTIAGLSLGGALVPGHAYLAGLLHDIGRFVMFEAANEDLGRVDETHWVTPEELLHNERQLLGYDHVKLGLLVCRRWSLPPDIAEVIALHHDYGLAAARPVAAPAELIRAVQMADLLSVRLMLTPDFADREPEDIARDLAHHCMRTEWPQPPVSPSVLAQRVAAIRDEAAALAESLLGPQPVA